MICSLKGAKEIPRWMVLKAIGSLVQSRIEHEQEVVRRGEIDEQDIGEFVEDRYVEHFGKGKLALDHLRDMIRGLELASHAHVRIGTFRRLTALVPGDEDAGVAISESCAVFFQMLLRVLVEVLLDDHLSGLRGAAFWTHYGRNDEIKIPTHYWDKVLERFGSSLKSTGKSSRNPSHVPAAMSMSPKQNADAFRAWKALEKTLDDCAADRVPGKAELQASDTGTAAKVVEVGDFPKTGPHKVKRADLDCFIDRALTHYTQLEDLEEEMIVTAYSTWDTNGDGLLGVEEFTGMILHANPQASQPRVTRAFMVASGGHGEQVDRNLLPRALIANGFKLLDRPLDEAPSVALHQGSTVQGSMNGDAAQPRTRAPPSLHSVFRLSRVLARMAACNTVDISLLREDDLIHSDS